MDLILRRNTSLLYEDDTTPLITRTIKKINTPVSTIGENAFRECAQLTEVNAPNATKIDSYAFYDCTSLTEVNAPNCLQIQYQAFRNCNNLTTLNASNTTYARGVAYCGLTHLYLPVAIATGENQNNSNLITAVIGTGGIKSSSSLEAIDFTAKSVVTVDTLQSDSKLQTLVIRGAHVAVLSNASNFNSTPFASGGTGGTIYIPKSLYDQLGTGVNDYKAATNWSTIDGYGTITWAQIEGSQYEHYYVDGTPIPTESEDDEPDDTTTVYESSTGLSYTPTMTIDVNGSQIHGKLSTYGNMPYLKKLVLTGVMRRALTTSLDQSQSEFSVEKYPSLKKLYIQPTKILNDAGKEIDDQVINFGHYILANSNLKEIVLGKLGGPYWHGAGYFGTAIGKHTSNVVGSKDGLKLTVYTDAYSTVAGFYAGMLDPTTELHCIDYQTGTEMFV